MNSLGLSNSTLPMVLSPVQEVGNPNVYFEFSKSWRKLVSCSAVYRLPIFMITYQDKATQADLDNENTIEKILNTMTLLCTKLDTMDKELKQIKSQQHDAKHAELSPSDDSKIP
ncbi:hypothetical protein H5410_014954 [Solanum commersonii]|uniref:Uncharacterized protein n=1 Tax=Solanum commersonii TaxID=4109 RepID=A0A9J5ZSX4_SOLCO|nr:hypothetical protein H5410_014954 [Solanum commersonii]